MFFVTSSFSLPRPMRYFNYQRMLCRRVNVIASLQQSSAQKNRRPPSLTRCRDTIKRKVVMCIGYDGALYHGLQRNPGVQTVSDVLEKAIHTAGGISDDNVGMLEKVKWQNAARTDRGVSAAGNMISLKLLLRKDEDEYGEALSQLTKRINYNLPDHVRVFGISRVTNSFSAKSCCGSRWYEYMIPLSTFSSEVCLDTLSHILQKFEGTRLFHNYTVGTDHCVPPRDQARRFIIQATCDPEPVLLKCTTGDNTSMDEKWARIRIKGQSFMLHQVRKMVSMALLAYTSRISLNGIDKSFSPETLINIPPAPAAGLFLDSCHFNWYNERHHDKLAEPISTVHYNHEREVFKEQVILPSVAQRLAAENPMPIFWETVDRHFKPPV